jgi:hypothetical protein
LYKVAMELTAFIASSQEELENMFDEADDLLIN